MSRHCAIWLVRSAFPIEESAPAWLSAAALGAGMAAVAVKLSSFPAFFTLVYHAQPLDPNLARALFEMNSFAFLVTWYLQAALLLAVTALSLAHRALPLWLGVPAGLIARGIRGYQFHRRA